MTPPRSDGGRAPSCEGDVQHRLSPLPYPGSVQTPVDDHLTGRVLEGRYTVGPRLARGGTAGVYRAVDRRLERTVAIKIMHAHLSEDPAFVDRFAHEARAAARLSHYNVVAVLDQGRTDDGLVFLVMEYIEGGTMRDVLRRKGFLRPGEALEVLAQIAQGLAAAHRAGLIHRDIKPENVLMRPDGTVKVADFGLSRAADQHTTSGAVLGTVAYAAPELVTEQRVGTRSDIYSLGILAWEMLTGRRPFEGSPWAIARAHAEKVVPTLSEAVPGIAPAVAEAIRTWTAKDPADRPERAAAVAEQIDDLRGSLSPDQLAFTPQGWEQGPGPVAPMAEDPGATVLPSTAPATGPIDRAAILAAARPGAASSQDGDSPDGPAPDGSTAQARSEPASPEEEPITRVHSVPLSTPTEAIQPAPHPSAPPEAPTEALPATARRSSSPGETATEALPATGHPQQSEEAATEAMPATGGSRGSWMSRDGADDGDQSTRTTVLPTAAAGAAGVAGAAAGAGSTGAMPSGPAPRSAEPGARHGAAGSAGATAIGAWRDPQDRRRASGTTGRLAAFDEDTDGSAAADGETGETTAQTTRADGRLRENAAVDPSSPTVRLQTSSPLRIMVALALTALLIALAAFAGWLLGSGSLRTAVVPDVTGTAEQAAVSTVEDQGFSNVRVREEPSTDVPEGTVIDTAPRPEAETRVGEQIVINVSTGPEQVAVPQLEGVQRTEAQSRLGNAGLGVGTVTEQFDDSDTGTVVAASPSPDTRVEQGTTVDLTVSAGPEPAEVPRVIGSGVDDARQRLEDVGFTVEVEEVAGGRLGRVISQSQDGATITLRVL